MSERVKDVLVNQVFILKQVQVKQDLLQDLQHDYTLKAGKQKALTIPVHSTAPAATSSVGSGWGSICIEQICLRYTIPLEGPVSTLQFPIYMQKGSNHSLN